MKPRVTYEKDGKIGTITLNNPEKSNTLDLDVLRLLIESFKQSEKNEDVCVIYRAEGKNFTFGADLKHGYELTVNPALINEAVADLWTWQELTTVMLNHPGLLSLGIMDGL